MKALVGAFNQEKALVGAFSVIVQPVVEPMEHYTALIVGLKSAPCVNAANVPVPCAAGFHYGKRAAEAEPEAALVLAGHVPFGSSSGLDPLTQGLDPATQGYAPYAHLAHAHYPYAVYGKREAEADPQVILAILNDSFR